ncbi:MAG: DNA-directed RNA polymerase subunit omega [Clostridia bacterium]|nr:DNA-directed RNA polymerase subunit omega [Clostridia bacterium]
MNITDPGISFLSKRVDSRYTLVAMVAKRARMIGEKGTGLVACDSNKAVSIAVQEIAAGKVGYTRYEKTVKDGLHDVLDENIFEDDTAQQG